jgi:hypothetical protein
MKCQARLARIQGATPRDVGTIASSVELPTKAGLEFFPRGKVVFGTSSVTYLESEVARPELAKMDVQSAFERNPRQGQLRAPCRPVSSGAPSLAVKPSRTALQRERCLPFSNLGPVLLDVLRRLAAICLNESLRTCRSDWLRFVV